MGEALAEIVLAEIELLVSKGVRLIQLNNPFCWGSWPRNRPTPAPSPSRTPLPSTPWRYAWTSAPRAYGSAWPPARSPRQRSSLSRAEKLYGTIGADRWILPFDQGTPLPNSPWSRPCPRTVTSAWVSSTRPRPRWRTSTR
ncbi:hypothetical protein ACRAWF_21235 [Streptomyces sp. L7]